VALGLARDRQQEAFVAQRPQLRRLDRADGRRARLDRRDRQRREDRVGAQGPEVRRGDARVRLAPVQREPQQRGGQ
jgi:hypothetical protein